MNSYSFLRIFQPGGYVTIDDLRRVVKLAHQFNIQDLQFGLRQDIIVPFTRSLSKNFKKYAKTLPYDHEIESKTSRNIVSSLVAANIFPTETWLTDSIYLAIIQSFDYKPKLKINIVDPNQGLVPVYTGELNFIASKLNNYWYLSMQLPNWFSGRTLWPCLIYSDDIAKVAHSIELIYQTQSKSTLSELYNAVNQVIHATNNKVIDHELNLPDVRLPYYEGFVQVRGKYWLGIFKRTYLYPVDMLEAICDLCQKTKIDKLYITPWRSIIIKDIEERNWPNWVRLLGRYNINIRHAAAELNWRIADFDSSGLDLKMYLVNELDKYDVRTYGLTFAIRTREIDLDAIVVIEKVSSLTQKYFMNTYNVYHTRNFDPNQSEYLLFAKSITSVALPRILQQLTKVYYEYLDTDKSNELVAQDVPENELHIVYQCKHCHTTYEKDFGDTANGVVAGTSFESIPETYTCPVCDAPKADFEPIGAGLNKS